MINLLAKTQFPSDSTFFITLRFKPGTTPKAAKPLFSRFRKWILRNWPQTGGFHSLEFKNRDEVHYHLLVSFHSLENFCKEELKTTCQHRWQKISKISEETVFYFEPYDSLIGSIGYMAKDEEQRMVPDCYRDSMTRFWGKFGHLKSLPSETLRLPESHQKIAREVLANVISEQEGWRAIPYAEAIRQSRGRTFARLQPEQVPGFLANLGVPDAGQFKANT